MSSRSGSRGAAGLALAVTLGLAGCAEVPTPSSSTYQPASVRSTSPDGPKTVAFTEEGAARVALQTSVVADRGKKVVVDYAALVYDKTGEPWVFTVTAPLTFVRVAVEVDRVDGDEVLLDRGPAPGTEVVTQGAAEVWGAELGIAGKH